MLIKNLPRPIKELVFKRQIEQGNEPNEDVKLTYGKSLKNFNFWETTECAQFWREISKQNYKPFFEKYGGVILCTSYEQGAKIIEYFKSFLVDTGLNDGSLIGYYYGFVHGHCLSAYNEMYVKEYKIPIFTLDELGVEQTIDEKQPELPEINFDGIQMEVWDDEDEDILYQKRKVIAKINGRYLIDDWTFWDNARPIQQKVKVTKEQID